MANEFKKCPNGHYYQGSHCPYCKSSGTNTGGNTGDGTGDGTGTGDGGNG